MALAASQCRQASPSRPALAAVVGRRPGQLSLARPHHFVLHQRVHVSQHRVRGPAVLALGRTGRDAGVGDQPGQDAAHVGAVLSGLVPNVPGVRRPGREHGHVRRPGRDSQQRIADGLADGGHGVMRDAGERRHRHRGCPAQVHVGARQHGHVAHRERLGQLDQQRQARREPGAPFDALKPRGRHADQPGEHRPGQALALAQDLDALASPLPGEVIEHQLTSGLFHQLLAAYAALRPACQGTQTPLAGFGPDGGIVTRGASACGGAGFKSFRIVRKKDYDMGVAVPPEELDGLSLPGSAVLFLGVSTAGSAVHRYFPRWAGNFPEPVRLIGVDLPGGGPRAEVPGSAGLDSAQ